MRQLWVAAFALNVHGVLRLLESSVNTVGAAPDFDQIPISSEIMGAAYRSVIADMGT
jgi:hypothetical protein